MGKKVKGSKRHIIVDTQGFVQGRYVGPANENDRYGVRRVLDDVVRKHTHIKRLFTGIGYQGQDEEDGLPKICPLEFSVDSDGAVAKGQGIPFYSVQ